MPRSASRGRKPAKVTSKGEDNNTPKATRMSTRKATPKEAPKETPKETPEETPKETPKAAAAAAVMIFEEGDRILAKWPGTSLFFRAKISYVRYDDQEYDVQYEDGTIFTIKAKDVSKQREVKTKPARSQSRGRSPGRKSAAAAKSPSTSQTRQSRSSTRGKPAATPVVTPTRQSARIAEKREFSADPAAAKKKSGPCLKDRVVSFFTNLSFEWIGVLIFTALSPFILISLHILCTASSCKPALPFDKIPKSWKAYWDTQAFGYLVGCMMLHRLLMLLPIGSVVRSPVGHDVRMNGFLSLLLAMGVVPALIYKKINLNFVSDKYFHLMTSAMIYSVITAVFLRIKAHFFPERKTNRNKSGNTGNFIVDICNGRETSPFFTGVDVKLAHFRFSMVALAMLNVVMVINAIMKKDGDVNPVIVLASSFQVLYALDALFFEEYFFFSHDYMNSGLGLNLICSYVTFPFIPTLITQYLIFRSPTMKWYYLLAIACVNAFGYILFRASESQRCEFIKNPNKPSMKNMETISGAGGKKLLVSGWWGIVRHPNYLGELLIQWSWVLPAACTAGKIDLLIYYLPIMTTLVLIMRCKQQNQKNKRKFGAAWSTYCERVPSNLIPKVL